MCITVVQVKSVLGELFFAKVDTRTIDKVNEAEVTNPASSARQRDEEVPYLPGPRRTSHVAVSSQ